MNSRLAIFLFISFAPFCESVTFYVNKMCVVDESGTKRYRTDSGYRICSNDACPTMAQHDTPCMICCKQCNYDVTSPIIGKTIIFFGAHLCLLLLLLFL